MTCLTNAVQAVVGKGGRTAESFIPVAVAGPEVGITQAKITRHGCTGSGCHLATAPLDSNRPLVLSVS